MGYDLGKGAFAPAMLSFGRGKDGCAGACAEPCNQAGIHVGPVQEAIDVAFLGRSSDVETLCKASLPLVYARVTGDRIWDASRRASGIDTFVDDPFALGRARSAGQVVVQLADAQYQSNLFYMVHPRRSDRFVKPTYKLRTLYPEVNFSGISFVGHLIERLNDTDPVRFKCVAKALVARALDRTHTLLRRINRPCFLLVLPSPAAVSELGLSVSCWVDRLDLDWPFPVTLLSLPGCTVAPAGEDETTHVLLRMWALQIAQISREFRSSPKII